MLAPHVLDALADVVGHDGLIARPGEARVYECDGWTMAKQVPDVVVLPRTSVEVAGVLRILHRHGVAFVPRGAGTGLSGGCLPLDAPVMVCTSRLNRIVEIDAVNRRAIVEAGVVNLAVSRAVAADGLLYAPDPSSQSACTIGGNVAENSGGPHTLKYGVTTNHVLAVELVLPDGEVVELGGAMEDVPGYDLRGLVVGGEGTFGLVTRATLRLVREPEQWRTLLGVFETVDAASSAVSGIIAAGIVPAALEMMDRLIVEAVEAAFHFGFPTDAGAVLIVELDGPAAELDQQMHAVIDVCRAHGAREVRVAEDAAQRAALWKSRKRAFGAVGRLAPNYCTQDGVVPRTKVPDILRAISAIGEGNIHPILLYDERDADEVERVIAAGQAILRACVDLGGSITGEHGIGVEKINELPLIFSPQDLLVMRALRAVFDPDQRANPGKIFPTPGACVEITRPRKQASA